MNLIESVAESVVKGMKAAEIAVELGVKHGLEVGEAWVSRIMGADGFEAAVDAARERAVADVATAEADVKEEVADVKQEGEAVALGVESRIGEAEEKALGEGKQEAPAPSENITKE